MSDNNRGEASFTMIETVIALGLMVTVILQVSSVMGHSISFTDYERKRTQAGWLAKSVFAKLEKSREQYDLKEFEMSVKEQGFDETLCPKDPKFECDFKYNLEIKEWPLPIVELIAKQIGGGGEGGEESPILGLIREKVKEILGDEILKVAHLEVYWPEGSHTGSLELAYLLPSQKPMNQFISTLPKPKPPKPPKKTKNPKDPKNSKNPKDTKGTKK